MSECENCKDVTLLQMAREGVKCGVCGRSGVELLPEIKASRGPVKFHSIADQ